MKSKHYMFLVIALFLFSCSEDATKEVEQVNTEDVKINMETEQELNEAHETQSEALILEAELEEFIESLETN